MNYQEAVTKLDGRTSRKLENNTYLERHDDNNITVRLHQTEVITFYPCGLIKLRNNGWRTVTTKDRINKYSPVRIKQKRYEWTVYFNGESVPFTDGMLVRPASPHF